MASGAQQQVRYFDIPDFAFQDGTRLPVARVAYADINPQASKVVLIPTCFRGRIQTTLNFSDGALRDYRVIVPALFGNGESSSPSNTSGFPNSIDYRDCVRAQQLLVTKHLDIQSLDAVIGFSMGGQTTYYWTAMFPDLVQNAVIICSSARTSPHNYQFLEGPRAALENAIDYAGSDAQIEQKKSPRGLNAFGKAYSAWLTSAEWFDQELWKDMGCSSLAEFNNLVTTGYDGWHPDDLLVMLRMWQNGDVSVCISDAKTLEEALAEIKTRILLMPCETDQYFRPAANEREVAKLPNAKVDVIPSVWGHIGGGGASPKDKEWMNEKIASFLATS